MLKISLYDEVKNLDNWYLSIALAEQENAYKVLEYFQSLDFTLNDHPLVEFLEAKDEQDNIVARCLLVQDEDSNIIELQALYTYPKYRGKGYAKEIVKYAVDRVEKLRICTRRLPVMKICKELDMLEVAYKIGYFSKVSEKIYLKENKDG